MESTQHILSKDTNLSANDFIFVIENSPEYPIPIAFLFYKGEEEKFKEVLEAMQEYFTNYSVFDKPYWRP